MQVFWPEKKSCFLGSPGCVRLLRGAGDRFYGKKMNFYDKKNDFRPETRESRVSRRTIVLPTISGLLGFRTG